MDNETANALVGWISNALNTAQACQVKLAALENLLRTKDERLYAEYAGILEQIINPRAIDANAQGLEGLRAKLVRQS